MLPWRFPDVMLHLRHLRLNLYLPNPYSTRLWEEVLSGRLTKFVQAIGNGGRLKDLKVLIATWYHFHIITIQQTAVLGILEQIRVQGHVQVKTRSISEKLRAVLQGLNLTEKMRTGHGSRFAGRYSGSCEVTGTDMDWDWEGGILI
jgi:hypothetical protein